MVSVLAPAASAGAETRSMTASPVTTLEDVALRLFHLLHSPPLSLATLVRTGLLAEEEDVQGRRTLVLPKPAVSPNTTSHSAVGESLVDRAVAPQAGDEATSNTLSGPAPAVGNGGLSCNTATTHIGGDAASIHSNIPLPLLAERRRCAAPSSFPPLSTCSPADTIGSPVTASALSLSSPTAASGATSLRIARISADGLAHRLADLYAHHPPYALREWLHREAMRLACPTYQDPVSNDITATADALRQREELVKLYTRLYEQRHPQGPAVSGEEVKEDSAVVAWRRGLHLLMGCRHVRERHCPHRAVDGFKRAPTPAPAGGGAVAPLLRHAVPPGMRRDASVALRFVQQLLRSTPAAPRRRCRACETGSVGMGHQHTAVTTSAGKSATEQRAVAGGATVTFVRPPEAKHVYQGVVSSIRGRTSVPAAPRTPDAVPCAATDVTSLDCMIGVGDSVEVQNTLVADTAEPPADAAAPGAADTPSHFSAIPVRRGPRIRLRRAAENPRDVREDREVENSFIAADASTTSRSSSSSLSLPVAREEDEDELSLSESGEEDEDEEGEEDEESAADDHVLSMRRHGNTAAEDKSGGVVGELLHHGSRQSAQFPTLSAEAPAAAGVVPAASPTATTVDFLASRTGRIFGAAAPTAAPLTAAAVSCMASNSSNPAHEPVGALSVNDLSIQLGEPHQQQQEALSYWARHPEELSQHVSPSTPLLAGYSLTLPFTLAELPPAEATALLHLPFYAQAHELNRLSGLRCRSCYQDPYTHCLILTSHFLERLPHCYGEYCKHCPHGEVCQRRLQHPVDPQPRHRRHRGSSRRHLAWRVEKVRAAFDPTSTKAQECVQRGEGSSSSSGGTGSYSSPEDDGEDDVEALHFFAALDAAETAAPYGGAAVLANTGACAPSDLQQQQQQQQPQETSAWVQCLPQVSSGAFKSMSHDSDALLRPFSSHSTPSNLSASSSCFFSYDLAVSEGDEDPDEQHRHHLLRSYGDVVAGSGAGVVVQVNSLRDLLAWGAGNLADEATAAAAAGHLPAGVPGSLVAATLDKAAGIGSEMNAAELLRRHEASLEQYTYLDSSGL